MNTTQSHPIQGSIRSAPFVAIGVASVAIVAIVVVALGGPGGRGSDSGVVIPLPSTQASTSATLPPSPAPTSAPTVAPSPASMPGATAAPADGGRDAMPTKVDLQNTTGADVYVDIVDRTGLLTGASSGTPGDGASVESYSIQVENLDATTLKLTWTDFPIDKGLALYIDRHDGGYRLLLVQPEPTGETDAMGFDRELILTFFEPVSASQVDAFLQGGLDTPG